MADEQAGYELHESVFRGDVRRVSALTRTCDVARKDRHGKGRERAWGTRPPAPRCPGRGRGGVVPFASVVGVFFQHEHTYLQDSKVYEYEYSTSGCPICHHLDVPGSLH